jgi:hypothetical protein
MKTPALRYENLYKQIRKFKPTSILEVGVWMGDTAVKMIQTAQSVSPGKKITYLGFDLFEDITDEEIVKEHSKSRRATFHEIYTKVKRTGANVFFYKGYTKDTLAIPRHEQTGLFGIDFIFVDGGHSIETIQSDWDNLQKFLKSTSIIIFDDYFYDRDDLGCKNLIDNLDRTKFRVDLLKPIDHFPKEGWTQHTQMVKVTLL